MKSNPIHSFRSLIVAACLAGAASAQQATSTAPRPATSPTSTVEEAVVLSPFEVASERDTGFSAASAFSGGRLASELRDTPVSYSIITRDFIDALNLTDLQQAADWTTGGTLAYDIETPQAFGQAVNYSTRGSSPGVQQRNFFPQRNNLDSYNLERYDFGRGPNAILFGNGSIGGVSSSSTKRAQTNRAFQSVELGVGSWRNYRATLDVNRPINDKLALRLAGVWGDSDGWRMKDFDRRKAIFLTTTFRPTKNLEVRLEGEYGTNKSNRGFTTINELFAGWDGRTTYNGRQPLSTLPGNSAALGINRRGANYFVYDPFDGQNAIMNYQNDPITRAGGSTATTPIAGFVSGTNAAFNSGGRILHSLNVPNNRFDNAIAGSAFRIPSEEFTMNIDAPILLQRFKDLQLTVAHHLGDFHFEIAGDVNRAALTVNAEQNRQNNNTYIDINRVKPNGAPNPHFLQPYGDGQFNRSNRNINYNNVRGAAAYVKDTRFGHFTFNTMAGINLSETIVTTRWMSIAQGNDHRQWGALSQPANQRVYIRRYWNETSRPMPDLSAQPITFVDLTGAPRQIQPLWVVDASRRDTDSHNFEDFKYVLGALNAKFFKDRVVFLGAVRYDHYDFLGRQQISLGDYPLDWSGQYRILRPDAPADYNSLTFVPKDAQGRPTGPAQEAAIRPRNAATGDREPQYAGDRFKDDFNGPAQIGGQITKSIGSVVHLNRWLNPSFNYAETFNKPAPQPRIDSSPFPPTIAKGYDYGLRVELMERRLNLNFTYYQTEEINADTGGDGPSFFNDLFDANIVGDQTSGGRNIRGMGRLPVQYRDSRTRSADGFEVELAYNPTKALRLTANVAFPKVYESELNPDVKAYIDTNGTVFRQIANDAGVNVSATNVASVNTTIPANNRSPDAQQAADAYNAIYDFRANIVEGKRRVQDQPIINFYTDYTFQEGWLKRLRVGAGVRYRGKQIAGFRGSDTIVNPANRAQAIDDPNANEYTPVYTPDDFYLVTGSVGYSWRMKDGRELRANLVVNNLLNDRGPIYGQSTVVRPRDNDYNSPARETVPNAYGLKQPISYSLTLTMKL
ncbi:MAG TPA: TonB-dependent receptor plug domain-containing protein [Opitutaceae bacterium]|nr:TonB-dependent receptor plug domain-containing protein [Opitutaceae bacterium]